MKKKTQYRLLTILAILVASVGLLSYFELNLGLDLRGGTHLILHVDPEEALQAEIDQTREAIERSLVDGSLSFSAVETIDSHNIAIRGVSAEARPAVDALLDAYDGAYTYSSRSSGDSYDYSIRILESYRKLLGNQSVRQAREVVSRRVDAYGVAEPTITIYGSGEIQDQIIVELPGVEDFERVKTLITEIAKLELKLIHPQFQGTFPDIGAAAAALGGSIPADYEALPYADTRETGGQLAYMIVKRAPAITGAHLKNARRSQDQFTGRSEVLFFLTAEGVQRFGETTGANVNKRLAIVLDGRVISAPNIDSRIDTETARITGSFTAEEADDLALSLRSGALPAKPTILEERSVGPSLGHDSIVRGIYASLLGIMLVVLGMLVVYKLSGFNAIVCLTLNLLILMGILAYFRATLTLPGIAGIILTIGMAVDANILIFERIKEELRLGKTVRSAVDAAFGRVFSTIVDTNVTTLVAALFLFQFGTGPVRGFAVTLAVGLLANIFTATFVSKTLFSAILQQREIRTLSI